MAGVVEEAGRDVQRFAPGACDFCREGRLNLCDDLLFWNGATARGVGGLKTAILPWG